MQLIKYGQCNIEIPIKSIPRLLIEEVLNPFYIFQFFSMGLWYWDGYQSYATCILLISVISAVTSLVDTLTNLRNIKRMAYYSCPVNVMRCTDENNLIKMESVELVPGDVIEIPENCSMPCDLILLTGSCIVNESMLNRRKYSCYKECTFHLQMTAIIQTMTRNTLYTVELKLFRQENLVLQRYLDLL